MKNKNDFLQEIRRLKSEEKFEEACKFCEEFLKTTEEQEFAITIYIDILFAYGHYLNEDLIQEYEKAAEVFEKIISLQSNNVKAIYYAGVALFHSNKFDDALERYLKIIELEPNFKHAYYNIGLLYETKGDFDNALKFYNKALDLDPHYLYARHGKNQIEEVLRMTRVNRPDIPVNYEKLKSLLKSSKRVEIRTIQKYLNIDEYNLDKIISWCEKYDFQIDGPYLEINKDHLSDLLKEIDEKGL